MLTLLQNRIRKRQPADQPFTKLNRLILEQAVKDGSPLICFGIPREVPTPTGTYTPPTLDDITDPEILRQLKPLLDAKPDEAIKKALAASSHLRYWNGCPNMSLWYQVQGKFYEMMPPRLIGGLMAIVEMQNMLVALGATEQNPQPLRYIELYPNQPGRRRFVEIETVVEPDNTFRIKILRLREEPDTILVSSDLRGEQRALPPKP